VTIACPDIVHGDPGAIGLRGDISAQAPSQFTVFRAVVRCELVTRDYVGLGSWQVELAEVAYGNPTDLITQLRTPDQPAAIACGMGSQYGYPWFALVEADDHVEHPAVPAQGCGPSPSAVAALNELPFKVVDAVRIQVEAANAVAPGQLSAEPHSPDELALAPNGTLYIADGVENVIYARTAAGAFSVVAGTGVAGFTGDGGPATAAALNDPSGMLVEPDGTLLFADGMNHRLRAVAPDGRISTVAGNGQFAKVTRPGLATTQPVADPKDVAVDPHGGYYVAAASQLLHLSANGQLTVVAGNNALDGVVGIGGPALSASMDGPGSIAVDGLGGIYVAGQNTKTLLYITPNGSLTDVSDDFYVRGWGGLRPAPDGSVIGINSLQIVRYHGTTPTTIYDFNSTTVAGLEYMLLNGLAVSTSGDIYVSSDGNSGYNGTPTLVRIDDAGKIAILWTGKPTS
jgi:hypothetical protein